MILRKISSGGGGGHPLLGMCDMGMSIPDRTGSLPHGMRGFLDGNFLSFDEGPRFTLGQVEGHDFGVYLVRVFKGWFWYHYGHFILCLLYLVPILPYT